MSTIESNARIDGGKAHQTLNDRINSEEWVGASLQQKTREDYARKIAVLENQIRKLDGSHNRVGPERMSSYLADVFGRRAIAQATARSLKAAVLFWLAESAHSLIAQGGQGLSSYEQAYLDVRALATNALPTRTQRTSSPKLKALPEDVLETLERYGERAPGVIYIGTLLAFLRANILVGLRPEEWFDATPYTYLPARGGEGKPCIALRVRNSKASNGRANGTYREILLHSINAEQLATLMHFLELVEMHRIKHRQAEQGELAEAFFKPLRHCMSNALKKAQWHAGSTSRPTLYSSRHQAVANAKASGYSDEEIAALFGHISTSTAKTHYGKKLNGWMKTTFRPSPESLAVVKTHTRNSISSRPNDKTLRAAEEWIRGPSPG
jgi:integrase